jgi:hypothetical protein
MLANQIITLLRDRKETLDHDQVMLDYKVYSRENGKVLGDIRKQISKLEKEYESYESQWRSIHMAIKPFCHVHEPVQGAIDYSNIGPMICSICDQILEGDGNV